MVLEVEVILNKHQVGYLKDDIKHYPLPVNVLMNKCHITEDRVDSNPGFKQNRASKIFKLALTLKLLRFKYVLVLCENKIMSW